MFARLASSVVCVCFIGAVTAQDTVYRLNGVNSQITFIGSKKDGKHEGGFKELKGTITVKNGDLTTAQIKVDIDMKSMYTDNTKLTDHLKSPDFFNVAKNPLAKFASTKIEKKGEDFEVHGKLTMNGVTKDTHFPAKVQASSAGVSLESTFEINRHDWKISYRPGQIDDNVKLTLKVTAPR